MGIDVMERVDTRNLIGVSVSDSLSGIRNAVGSGVRMPIAGEKAATGNGISALIAGETKRPVIKPAPDGVVVEYNCYRAIRNIESPDKRISLNTYNMILGLLKVYSGRIHALMHNKWDNGGSVSFSELDKVSRVSELPLNILEGIRRMVALLENAIEGQASAVAPDYGAGKLLIQKGYVDAPDVRGLTACLLIGGEGKRLQAGVHCPGLGYDFTKRIKNFDGPVEAMLVLRADMSRCDFSEQPELLRALSQKQKWPLLSPSITLAAVSIDENRVSESNGERVEGRENITVKSLNSLLREDAIKASLRDLVRAARTHVRTA